MPMEETNYGEVKIHLKELIENRKISKNRLSALTLMQRNQLNRYCNGDVQRIDLGILAKLCYVLDCNVSDILEYVSPKEDR